MSERKIEFTKENIDVYLKELAKEYRKLVGKGTPAELVLIGGASVLINYGFRDMTTDIDALIHAASSMKDAINRVGDRFDLPNGWLNADFRNTSSYTPKLTQFSEYYKAYSNVVTIRTVSAEHLIAMKLRSGRQYKSDLSDVLGILAEHEKRGTQITMGQIRNAVADLYGDWSSLPDTSRAFIENVMENGEFQQLYQKTKQEEQETKNLLIQFEQDYPGVTTGGNVDGIAENLQKKSDKVSLLARLRQAQTKPVASELTRKPRKKHDLER